MWSWRGGRSRIGWVGGMRVRWVDRGYRCAAHLHPYTEFRTKEGRMARLDVRLDAERRKRLEELVEEQGVPISEVVRCLIDDAYEDVMGEREVRNRFWELSLQS